MPTGLEMDQHKAILSIALSLKRIGDQLEKLNKDGIKINEIEGLKWHHDCVPIVDLTKP